MRPCSSVYCVQNETIGAGVTSATVHPSFASSSAITPPR